MVAQNDYHSCLATKHGKIPTALVTVKTENTNYPESPQRCQIKLQIQNLAWWILFKYRIIPINLCWFSISTKHWNKSLMFHPIFFFTLCSGGPCPCPHPLPCPYVKTVSVISKAPSSTLWKSISPQQTAASASKMPKDAAGRVMGTQHGSGVQGTASTHPLPCPGRAGAVPLLPRLGTRHRAKTKPLGPSSIQQNHVGL